MEAAQAVGGRGSEPGSGSADRHRRSVFEGRLFDIRKLSESWTNQLEHSGDVGQGQDSAGEATGTGDLASSVWAKYVELVLELITVFVLCIRVHCTACAF